jgi:hypothetical protein
MLGSKIIAPSGTSKIFCDYRSFSIEKDEQMDSELRCQFVPAGFVVLRTTFNIVAKYLVVVEII